MYISATKYCLSEISANEWTIFKEEVYELDANKSFPIISTRSNNRHMSADDVIKVPKTNRIMTSEENTNKRTVEDRLHSENWIGDILTVS
jgi:hypothetical protein